MMRSGVVLIVLVLAASPAAWVQTGEATHPEPDAAVASNTPTTEFTWQTPPSFTGKIAFRFSVSIPEATPCTWELRFTGERKPHPELLGWFLDDVNLHGLYVNWERSPYAAAGDVQSSSLLPLGIAGLSMTSFHDGSDNSSLTVLSLSSSHWSAYQERSGTYDGERSWTIAAFRGAEWNARSFPALAFAFRCETAFHVTLAGSREAVGLALDDAGGVAVADDSYPLKANLQGGKEGAFESPEVMFRAIGLDTMGRILLQSPAGETETWVGPEYDLKETGGPGGWSVSWDLLELWSSAAVILGLAPLLHLDELL